MSEENQGGNQPQLSSNSQTDASNDSTSPQSQAVESRPMPEPSFGTHKKEAPRKPSRFAEKGDQAD